MALSSVFLILTGEDYAIERDGSLGKKIMRVIRNWRYAETNALNRCIHGHRSRLISIDKANATQVVLVHGNRGVRLCDSPIECTDADIERAIEHLQEIKRIRAMTEIQADAEDDKARRGAWSPPDAVDF